MNLDIISIIAQLQKDFNPVQIEYGEVYRRIQLLWPNNTISGPTLHKQDNRYRINLYRGKPINRARFYYCIYESRILLPEEHVHHQDEDTLNDRLSNLELLTIVEHCKEHKTILNPFEEYVCVNCGRKFLANKKKQHHINNILRNNLSGPYCTTSCSNNARSK